MKFEPVIKAMDMNEISSRQTDDSMPSGTSKGISDCDIEINGFLDMIKHKIVKKKSKTKNKAATTENKQENQPL